MINENSDNKSRSIKLKDLNLPNDLKSLDIIQLNRLCGQIRAKLIKTVSKTGGHLASNLGTVELTVALHKVFTTPYDQIVWDVGHQAYTHKILTGRYSSFNTLRQENGISGFPKRNESVHDAFVSGHSSTSISVALGIATGMKKNGDNEHHTIAVIGDGALTGGLAYEGLNNAGKSDTNLIVILNYNEMSISKNVGALSKYLTELRTKQGYLKTKSVVERVLDKTPIIGKPVKTVVKASKSAIKDAILHSTMFEQLGFAFIGPVDGHNIEEICEALENAKAMHKPVFIHMNTKKGKGYAPAEANPGQFHGIGKFEIATGNPDFVSDDSYSSEWGKALSHFADNDDKIVAITAAMKYGTGLQHFCPKHRNRFFDVGIAEQHAVTFSAGLTTQGFIPVFCVYSSFLQRAYDQLLHDASIGQAHIVIGIDRAGIVGEDGETHQGVFDVSFLTSIPRVTLYSPVGYDEMKLCLKKAIYDDTGIVGVRYPRGSYSGYLETKNVTTNFIHENYNGDTLIITYGRIYENVKEAVSKLAEKKIKCDILRLVKIWPYNDNAIELALCYKNIIFFEEGMENGSIAEKIGMSLFKNKYKGNYVISGITDYIRQASVKSAISLVGLDAESMVNKIVGEFYNK